MDHPLRTACTRLIPHLPGWIFLASGALLIAGVALTQPWLGCRQLRWQHAMMRLQADRLTQQEHAYLQFQEALESHDPVVLERLAYHQLRLKPAGSHTLATGTDPTETIESWLHTPLPRVGCEYPALQPLGTRLVRLSTGPMRLPLAGAGFLCVTAGLLSASVDRPSSPD